MNKTQTLVISDPFRAAYLLKELSEEKEEPFELLDETEEIDLLADEEE